MRLTPREREVVDLVVVEGLSYRRAGRQLGLEESTVGVYVHRIARRIPGDGTPLRKLIRALHKGELQLT